MKNIYIVFNKNRDPDDIVAFESLEKAEDHAIMMDRSYKSLAPHIVTEWRDLDEDQVRQ